MTEPSTKASPTRSVADIERDMAEARRGKLQMHDMELNCPILHVGSRFRGRSRGSS